MVLPENCMDLMYNLEQIEGLISYPDILYSIERSFLIHSVKLMNLIWSSLSAIVHYPVLIVKNCRLVIYFTKKEN